MTQVEIANLALAKLGEAVISAVDTTTTPGAAISRFWAPVRDQMLRRHRWNFARTRAKLEPTWVTATSVADDGNGVVEITKATHGLTTGNRVTLRDFGITGSFYITRVDNDTYTLDDSTWTSAVVAGDYTVAPPFGYAYKITLPSDCLRVLEINGIEVGPSSEDADFEVEAGFISCDVDEANTIYTAQITDQTKWDAQFIDAYAVRLAVELAVPLTGSMTKRQELLKEFENITMPDARLSDAVESRPKIRPQAMGSRAVDARLFDR